MTRFLAAIVAGLTLQTLGARADMVVPTRIIRPAEIVSPEALGTAPGTAPGALIRPEEATGMEALVTLYPGRPIYPQHLARPALVDRNAIIPLVYEHGGILISTEGRALGRGAEGERIRVMNLASRATLFGIVQADGSVAVTQ